MCLGSVGRSHSLRQALSHDEKLSGKNGRGGEIRTHDLYVPNVALYQAKLRPDFFVSAHCGAESLKEPQRHHRRKQKSCDARR